MRRRITFCLIVISLILFTNLALVPMSAMAADTTTSYTINGIIYTYDSNGNLISAVPVDTTQTVATSSTDTTTTDPTTVTTSTQEDLLISGSPDRTNPVQLSDEIVAGDIYVFAGPDTEIDSASFFIDDPDMTGTPLTTEEYAPFDLMSTQTGLVGAPFDSTTLVDGQHNITVFLEYYSGITEVISSNFIVLNDTDAFNLLLSTAPDHTNPVPLLGETVSGDIYVFAGPDTGVSQASFYLDDPAMTGSPANTETTLPFDFMSTLNGGNTIPFDTTTLPDGQHTITVALALATGVNKIISSDFTILNNPVTGYNLFMSSAPDHSNPFPLAGETVSGDIYVFTGPDSGINQASFFLDDPGMNSAPINTELYVPYDFLSTVTGGLGTPFDTSSLSNGTHNITVSIALSNGIDKVVSSNFTIDNGLTIGNYNLQAIPDSSSTELNTAVNIDILANDGNLVALPISISIVTPPENGQVVLEADNTITYTPDPDYAGTDNLIYEIVDANGENALANVAVVVQCSACLTDVLVTLTWNPNTDSILGYSVYYGPTADSASQLASDLPIDSGLLDPQSPGIQFNLGTDLGLAVGEDVCFRLKAYNDSGASDYSGAVCYLAV